ncbi:MAG: glycosyltransferase, partial [Candidatus Sungbacteria bacterium]|nr:glycosyltransferase [Candidatus Sungbacteria bacterium]
VVSLPFSGDIHRLMPAYAASAGAGVAEVPVAWQRRRYGVSKYGLMRTFRVILDVIVFYFFGKYGARPMHFFGVAGFISAFLGFLTFIWMLLLKLLEGLRFTQSPLPVLTTFFFMIAVQFVLMGLLAEMLHRVFKTSEAGAALPIKETLRF